MTTINETIENEIRAKSGNALRALAARAHRNGWRKVVKLIREEFRARSERREPCRG